MRLSIFVLLVMGCSAQMQAPSVSAQLPSAPQRGDIACDSSERMRIHDGTRWQLMWMTTDIPGYLGPALKQVFCHDFGYSRKER